MQCSIVVCQIVYYLIMDTGISNPMSSLHKQDQIRRFRTWQKQCSLQEAGAVGTGARRRGQAYGPFTAAFPRPIVGHRSNSTRRSPDEERRRYEQSLRDKGETRGRKQARRKWQRASNARGRRRAPDARGDGLTGLWTGDAPEGSGRRSHGSRHTRLPSRCSKSSFAAMQSDAVAAIRVRYPGRV